MLKAVAIVCTSAPAFGQTTGSVTGCFTDQINQPLPRVTVSLSAQGKRMTTLADDRGCYEFRELPAGVYRITARLLGFNNVTRDKVNISPGQIERVSLSMRVSTICECLARPTTLEGLYDQADVVVYARILHHYNELPSRPGFFTQMAEALETFKHHNSGGPSNNALTFFQNQSNGTPDPYDTGQELVLFLSWLPIENMLSEGLYPQNVTVVSIQAGSVTDAPGELGSYVGSPTTDLLAELRKLGSRR